MSFLSMAASVALVWDSVLRIVNGMRTAMASACRRVHIFFFGMYVKVLSCMNLTLMFVKVLSCMHLTLIGALHCGRRL